MISALISQMAKLKEHPFFVPSVVFIIEIVIAYLEFSFMNARKETVILSLLFTIIIVLLVTAIAMAIIKSGNDFRLKKIVAQQSEVLQGLFEYRNSIGSTPWLKLDSEYASLEETECGKFVWIISPDLGNVIDNDEFRSVVIRNLAKGISYKYIIPLDNVTDSDLNINVRKLGKVLADVKPGKGKPKGELFLQRIDEKNFQLFLETHIAILDIEGNRSIYLQLPYDGQQPHARGYWIKLNKDATSGFYNRLGVILKDYPITKYT